jgi:hypothetical protein
MNTIKKTHEQFGTFAEVISVNVEVHIMKLVRYVNVILMV